MIMPPEHIKNGPPEHIKKALEAIPDSEWRKIEKKLVLYTISKFVGTRNGGLRFIKGIPSIYHPHLKDMAEDFTHQAIAKLYYGERKTWNPPEFQDSKKMPIAEISQSLVNYLIGVIDSLLSAEVNSLENSHCIYMGKLDSHDKENEEGTHFQIADSCPTPEEQVLAQDEFEKFQSFCKKDMMVSKILECALEGITKRSDIAKDIGCTVNEVTNAKKRMIRMARQFFDGPLFV
ncbi:MAG: hypothetical protein VSS75_005165 [Candidatus Parabeggiatoa sp.]|nr:hypothetical protein [Candidatus Parabeggiatoa sp.]